MQTRRRVVREATTFTLIDNETAFGDWSYELLITTDRTLTPERQRKVAAAVGYAWAEGMRGERLGEPTRVNGRAFIVYADVTKSRRDDIGDGWEDFLQLAPQYVREGSPVRKTNRAGEGTKGTRLLEGVPGVNIRIWADQAAA